MAPFQMHTAQTAVTQGGPREEGSGPDICSQVTVTAGVQFPCSECI